MSIHALRGTGECFTISGQPRHASIRLGRLPHKRYTMHSIGGPVHPGVRQASAHLWRHLRSLNHAFLRSLDSSVTLTDLDKDRLRTLAEFFRDSASIETMDVGATLHAEGIRRVSHELVFAPRINLMAALDRTPEFIEWKRGWKKSDGDMILELTNNLEKLFDLSSEANRVKAMPEREARIVSSVLSDLIARTEPIVTR